MNNDNDDGYEYVGDHHGNDASSYKEWGYQALLDCSCGYECVAPTWEEAGRLLDIHIKKELDKKL
jgi:hypothetical protein